MPDLTLAESHPSPGTVPASRCLELRPVLDRLGLKPLVIGVGRVVIGSRAGSGLSLNVEGLAPEHVEIEFDGSRPRLRVISPLTWLNDGPVREATLRPGDVLTLGPIEFQVGLVDVPAPPPPPAPVAPAKPAVAPTATKPSAPEVLDSRPRSEAVKPARPPQQHSAPKSAAPLPTTLREKSDSSAPRATPPAPSQAPTTAVQPLLDEAAAAQQLRRDLSRLEQETAWHREHLRTNPVVEPPAPVPTSKASQPTSEQSARSAVSQDAAALAERESLLREEQRRLIHERAELVAQQRQLAAEQQSLQAERDALAMARSECDAVQSEVLPLRQEVSSLRSRLDIEQTELVRREQRLAEEQAEFDSAVAALDLDREQTRRASEAAQREAAQLRQRLERQQTELQERAQELAAEEERLRKLADDCDARELELEDKLRQQASGLRERESALSRREAALRGREAAIKAGQEDLETRRAQLQADEEAALRDREELETLRDEAQRLQADAQRQLRDVEAERDRLGKRNAIFADRSAQVEAEWERLSLERAEFEQSLAELRLRSETINERDAECQRLLDEVNELRQLLADAVGSPSTTTDETQTRGLYAANLTSELDEQRRQIEADQAAWSARVEESKSALAAERSRLEQWEQELRQQSAEANAANRIDELDARLTEVQEHEEALSIAVAELEQHREELTEWESRLRTQAAEIADREERQTADASTVPQTNAAADSSYAEELQAVIAELTTERNLYQSELQAALETQQAIEEEFRWMQAEADRTAAEREELRQGRAELDRQAAELDSVREKLAAKEHQSESQRDRFREQQAELEALREELADERRRLTQLRATMASTDDDPANDVPSAIKSPDVSPSDIFADETPASDIEAEEEGVDPVRSAANVWFSGMASETAATSEDQPEHVDSEQSMSRTVSPSDIFESPVEADGDAPRADSVDAEPYNAPAIKTPRPAATVAVESPHTTQPATGESNAGIRSQLAMLFGISREQLDETETRHHDDLAPAQAAQPHDGEEAEAVARERELANQLKQAARDIGEKPKAKPAAAAALVTPVAREEHPEGEDSVAAYMQRLLAKSALTDSSVIENQKPASESSRGEVPQPTRYDDPADDGADQYDRIERDADEPAATSSASLRGGRRLDRQEREEIRANIDSMRQIANLSARSAVARHYASKLEVTRKVKTMLAGLAGGVSVLLLSAELWTSNSYRLPGICAGVVAIIAGIELARTSIQMKRVQQIAGTSVDGKTDEDEG